MTASPIERVIIVYDVAIAACGVPDRERALRAVSLLRQSLDWEAAPEIAPRLQALYEYCEECIRGNDYDTPLSLLRELRDAWAEARTLMAAAARQPAAAVAARPAYVGVSALNVAG